MIELTGYLVLKNQNFKNHIYICVCVCVSITPVFMSFTVTNFFCRGRERDREGVEWEQNDKGSVCAENFKIHKDKLV